MNRPSQLGGLLFMMIAMSAVVSAAHGILGAGVRVNVVRHYFPNGVLAAEKEMDAKGEPHGLLRAWDERGILKCEHVFNHGCWTRQRYYGPSGKLVREITEGADFLPVVNTSAE